MSSQDKLEELGNLETKLSSRYLMLFRLFIIVIILLIILIVISAIGIIFLGLGTNWIIFRFEGWIIGLSLLIGLFIFLEMIFYLHFFLIRRKKINLEKPKPEYINGKKVYDITFPRGTDGGVYSKTYIEIDNQNILRIKNLMIPPDELF